MKKVAKKKKYKKPEITFCKKIEILAGVCNSAWSAPSITCRLTPGECDFIRD